jgi:hypothetical protein
MAGAPWYLLAGGIVLVILGFLIAGLSGPSDEGRLDARMRDDEIARELKRRQRMSPASYVVLAGLACVLVSVVWRLAL